MAHASDWGFAEFFPLKELQDSGAGWVVEDTVHIRATVSVDVTQSSCYDSRMETGFVGLRNQGGEAFQALGRRFQGGLSSAAAAAAAAAAATAGTLSAACC